MGCEAVRTFSSLAGKHPKMAEKQTYRRVSCQLAKSSPLPLDRVSAKGRDRDLGKACCVAGALTKVVTVTTLRSHLLRV